MTARILLMDIETAPNLGWIWGKYEQNVIEFEQTWFMLCFGYKWLGEDSVRVCSLPDYGNYKHSKTDDSALVRDLRTVLDEADIVIGHNVDAFDVKKTNARLITHGVEPPSPYKTVDTLKLAKKHFRFDGNKLNDLGEYLELGRKLSVGWPTWKGCIEGDEASWAKMVEYNARDVLLLEQVYLKLRPWATTHPDVSLGNADGSCPTCGSTHIQRRGKVTARTRQYQRLNCQDCGHWFQGPIVKA